MFNLISCKRFILQPFQFVKCYKVFNYTLVKYLDTFLVEVLLVFPMGAVLYSTLWLVCWQGGGIFKLIFDDFFKEN